MKKITNQAKIKTLTDKLMKDITAKENKHLQTILERLDMKLTEKNLLKKLNIRMAYNQYTQEGTTTLFKWFERRGKVLFNQKVRTTFNIMKGECIVELIDVTNETGVIKPVLSIHKSLN